MINLGIRKTCKVLLLLILVVLPATLLLSFAISDREEVSTLTTELKGLQRADWFDGTQAKSAAFVLHRVKTNLRTNERIDIGLKIPLYEAIFAYEKALLVGAMSEESSTEYGSGHAIIASDPELSNDLEASGQAHETYFMQKSYKAGLIVNCLSDRALRELRKVDLRM